MAGLIQKMVRPDYSGAGGAVVMMARIDKTGKVVNLKAMSGPEFLRDSAIKAARQWTYKPYLLNGQPVTVLTTITVNFQR
jgi:protein TonB